MSLKFNPVNIWPKHNLRVLSFLSLIKKRRVFKHCLFLDLAFLLVCCATKRCATSQHIFDSEYFEAISTKFHEANRKPPLFVCMCLAFLVFHVHYRRGGQVTNYFVDFQTERDFIKTTRLIYNSLRGCSRGIYDHIHNNDLQLLKSVEDYLSTN